MNTPCRLPLCALVAVALLAGAGRAGAQPSPDAIRGKSAEVFERPEFQPGKPEGDSWLLRLLVDFIRLLASLHEVAPLIFWLFVIGCVLALVSLVIFVAYRLGRAYSAGGRRRLAREEAAQRVRLSASYRAEADVRAAEGDYTEAVRFLFLSLVYRLDERGRVALHKDYTNREYLELVGDRPAVRDGLRVLVDTLDDHWYAQRPCGRARYEECLEVYNRLAGA